MMQANKIANSDLLEILFDGRNKQYGAYVLRKNYNRRLTVSVSTVIGLCLAIFLSTMASKPINSIGPIVPNDTLVLEIVKNDEPEPPVVPVVPPPPAEQLRTVNFVVPEILPDDLVPPDEMPPTHDEIENAIISNMTVDGVDASNIVTPAPPVEATGTGLTTQPTPPKEDYDKLFTIVEERAEFPGGPDAWKRFLERYLVYPEQAVENGTQGEVRVEFIVNKQGLVSDIKALNNPGDGLAEEAVRIIKKSAQWKPAEQNGHKVNYRHIQSITFRLGN